MARTTSQLRDVCLSEGGFDSTLWSTAAVGWLNERHKQLVALAKWKFADSYSITTTVAGQETYTLSDLAIQLDWVEVDGERYFRTSPEAVDGLYEETWDAPDGVAGWYTTSANATGATKQIRIYPAPESSGLAITARVSLIPADLDTSSSNPVTPEDLEPALIAGAIATGKQRVENRPDMAEAYERVFQEGVVELRKRRISRGGGGASTIPVAGYQFPR